MKSNTLTFDLPQYIAQIKMSSKIRLLVEGKDDRTHLTNLIHKLGLKKIKIDTAEQIKGNCKKTAKNNRYKIDVIHNTCRGITQYNNLYYLADREFDHFNFTPPITDNLPKNKLIDNLYYTRGHSMENYFISKIVLQDAYSFLCSSEYKHDAFELFNSLLDSAYSVVAAISLAANESTPASYPLGVIHWEAFDINNTGIQLEKGKMVSIGTTIYNSFISSYDKWLLVTEKSPVDTCEKVSRGHTALVMLQRIFAACLFNIATQYEDEKEAKKIAEAFSKLSECQLAGALGEAWIRKAASGKSKYPRTLIQAIT